MPVGAQAGRTGRRFGVWLKQDRRARTHGASHPAADTWGRVKKLGPRTEVAGLPLPTRRGPCYRLRRPGPDPGLAATLSRGPHSLLASRRSQRTAGLPTHQSRCETPSSWQLACRAAARLLKSRWTKRNILKKKVLRTGGADRTEALAAPHCETATRRRATGVGNGYPLSHLTETKLPFSVARPWHVSRSSRGAAGRCRRGRSTRWSFRISRLARPFVPALIAVGLAGCDPQAAIGLWEQTLEATGEPRGPYTYASHPRRKKRLESRR